MLTKSMDLELYIRVTTSILGITYPLLLQVIARLDEKYSSAVIVEIFEEEKKRKWFKSILIISLICIVIRSLLFLIPFSQSVKYWVEIFAEYCVFISSLNLVVAFFFFVEKIIIYYTPLKFVDYLKKKYDSNDDIRFFNALSDIFILGLQKQNFYLIDTTSRIFEDAFNNERIKQHENSSVVYPRAYYSLVYKAIEEIVVYKNKRNKRLDSLTVGGGLLLGGSNTHFVSETTYSALWSNIVLAVKYEQDDMIVTFWENAARFFTYNIGTVQKKYGDFVNDKPEILNSDEVNQNVEEKRKLLEFTYALGGLLLYKKRYKCLDRIFQYTMSQPPDYVLLPDFMDEIFKQFVKFNDPYNNNILWISSKYPFPEQSGMRADDSVQEWICRYLSVLFLRQYSLQSNYTYSNPVDYPSIPREQSKKTELIISLDYFKRLILESLSNLDLIKDLQYEFITKKWCTENSRTYPTEFIDNLKETVTNAYRADAVNQPISKEKVNNMFSSITTILEKTIKRYFAINNPDTPDKDFKSFGSNGSRIILDKDAFAENPEVAYLNYDTVLAEGISAKIIDSVAYSFIGNKFKYYLLDPKDFFVAVDKLKPDSSYVIISMGINLPEYIAKYNISGLTPTSYNGLSIIQIPIGSFRIPSLFIINRLDLPRIDLLKPTEEEVSTLSLEKISETLDIYASVIDLHTADQNLRSEAAQNISNDDLDKSVLISVYLRLEILLKSNTRIIQLAEYSVYNQEGTPNSVNDIQEIQPD